MSQEVVYKSFSCHVCVEEDKSFLNKGNLRKHLKEHELFFTGTFGRRGKRDTKTIYIEKADLKNYENYSTKYGCPACEELFESLDSLTVHVSYIHQSDAEEQHKTDENARHQPMEISVDEQPRKKLKTEADAYQDIFNFETIKEADITTAFLKSTGVTAATLEIESNGSTASVPLITSQENINFLSSMSQHRLKFQLSLCKDPAKNDSTVGNGDYLFHCLSSNSSSYKGVLEYGNYIEVDEQMLNILNTDWADHPYLRQACAQLLAGAIIVEYRDILLINCVEVYNRKITLDRHYERFGGAKFEQSSLPLLKNKYERINIVKLRDDNSTKLIIGTFVFNALVTSSLRLDKDNCEPEVGSSTYSFTPSYSTKVYISNRSVTAANRTINQRSQFIDFQDNYAHLRQLRSKFSASSTYSTSRCSSFYTNNLACTPYTIFTIADATGNKIDQDIKKASRIFQAAAKAIKDNKGNLKKEELTNIDNGKDTNIMKKLKKLLDLYGDNDSIPILGNETVDNILMEISPLITSHLKTYNNNLKQNIVKHIKKLN